MFNFKVWIVADRAWRNSKKKEASVKRKCEDCFRKWRKKGSNPDDKPPLFPVDFKGRCPTCKSELKDVLPI